MHKPSYRDVQQLLRALERCRPTISGDQAWPNGTHFDALSALEQRVLYEHIVGIKPPEQKNGAVEIVKTIDKSGYYCLTHESAAVAPTAYRGTFREAVLPANQKISQIKLVRAITAWGLKEAKDFVEGQVALWLDGNELDDMRLAFGSALSYVGQNTIMFKPREVMPRAE